MVGVTELDQSHVHVAAIRNIAHRGFTENHVIQCRKYVNAYYIHQTLLLSLIFL